jgi:hypothetical protein
MYGYGVYGANGELRASTEHHSVFIFICGSDTKEQNAVVGQIVFLLYRVSSSSLLYPSLFANEEEDAAFAPGPRVAFAVLPDGLGCPSLAHI